MSLAVDIRRYTVLVSGLVLFSFIVPIFDVPGCCYISGGTYPHVGPSPVKGVLHSTCIY